MLRMFKIRIGDKEYPLTYSLRAFKAVSDKFGSPDKMQAALDSDHAAEAFEAQIFVLHELILAGARYATLIGEDAPAKLTLQETRVMSQLTKLAELNRIIKNTISLASMPSIEAAPAKKNTRKTIPTFEHYMWQALNIGLDYNTAMDLPFGELLSYIGENSIQNGAKEKIRNNRDEVIPDWD